MVYRTSVVLVTVVRSSDVVHKLAEAGSQYAVVVPAIVYYSPLHLVITSVRLEINFENGFTTQCEFDVKKDEFSRFVVLSYQ